MTTATPSAPLRALVTGAGGFIGSASAKALAQDFCVLAGVRRARPVPQDRVEAIACDLDDPAQAQSAVAGVDVVVHAAYGDEAAMPRQAETLLSGMTAAGVKNLIAFSSIAVYGARCGRIVESDAPEGTLPPYARAKAQCETLYRLWANQARDRRVVVLRPGIVYGAGSPFWIEKMAARVISGGWGVFPQGDGRAALIHVDDLARQVLAASRLLTGSERGNLPEFVALNAIGPETPSWNGYFSALAGALGRPPLRKLSAAEITARQALAAPAKVMRRLGLRFGASAALAPTPGELALFSLDADYSGEAAQRLLGLAPSVGLAEGLERCGLRARAFDCAQRKA